MVENLDILFFEAKMKFFEIILFNFNFVFFLFPAMFGYRTKKSSAGLKSLANNENCIHLNNNFKNNNDSLEY